MQRREHEGVGAVELDAPGPRARAVAPRPPRRYSSWAIEGQALCVALYGGGVVAQPARPTVQPVGVIRCASVSPWGPARPAFSRPCRPSPAAPPQGRGRPAPARAVCPSWSEVDRVWPVSMYSSTNGRSAAPAPSAAPRRRARAEGSLSGSQYPTMAARRRADGRAAVTDVAHVLPLALGAVIDEHPCLPNVFASRYGRTPDSNRGGPVRRAGGPVAEPHAHDRSAAWSSPGLPARVVTSSVRAGGLPAAAETRPGGRCNLGVGGDDHRVRARRWISPRARWPSAQ